MSDDKTNKKLALLDKPESDLTAAEKSLLRQRIGGAGLPFPMAEVIIEDSGELKNELGLIDPSTGGMEIYTYETHERVIGTFYRDMMVPSMMRVERDLLASITPESKGFMFTVFGDASIGKSHLFRKVSGLMHPAGGQVIDCGGMNMRELFFRTVIDYGRGVKEQLNMRIESGTVAESSLKILHKEFPHAVIERNGKRVLDWAVIGAPRDGETYETARRRTTATLEHIYEIEGIKLESNAFGIKTELGAVVESFRSGRPLFLDEFDKSKPETRDTFQTFMQFANGEYDEITLVNPMATTSEHDLKEITLYRRDRKTSFFIGLAGNEVDDGQTSHELSYSMSTRMDTQYVGTPTEEDFRHRLSQIWTGLPLTTLHTLRRADAQNDKAGFAAWLVSLRTAGLTQAEIDAIPEEQIVLLENYDRTIPAIHAMAEYYYTRMQLADLDSMIYAQQDSPYGACQGEIAQEGRAKRVAASFRTMIQDYAKAIRQTPATKNPANVAWSARLSDYFNENANKAKPAPQVPVIETLGKNLERVVLESIANATIGMPHTQQALISLCRRIGVLDAGLQQANPSNQKQTVAALLTFKHLSNMQELIKLRETLFAYLQVKHPEMDFSDADAVIPLRKLNSVIENVQEQKQPFVFPANIKDVVKGDFIHAGAALPTWDIAEGEEGRDLATLDEVLYGFTLPDFGKNNLNAIWPENIDDVLPAADADSVPPGSSYEDVRSYLTRTAKNDISIGFISVADATGAPMVLQVVRDDLYDKTLLVGGVEIDDKLRLLLQEQGVTYVWNGNDEKVVIPATAALPERVTTRAAADASEFFSCIYERRNKDAAVSYDEMRKDMGGLFCAFTWVAEIDPKNWVVENGREVLRQDTSLGEALCSTVGEPSYSIEIRRRAVTQAPSP